MNTTTTAPVYEANFQGEPIRRQLRRQVLALNYHAFAQCLCLLLTRLGYEDAQVAGRTGWKGRNREGGYDIAAWLPAGVGRRRVIVQAKQFDALPVFQRSVDELRGTCLRTGAAEALLITMSTFSPVARQNAATAAVEVASVRLLDGEELLDLLLRHRIGVWEEAGDSHDEPARLGIDHAFFQDLSRDFAGNGRRSEVPFCKPHEGDSRWLVTIRLGASGFSHTKRSGGKGSV